MVVVNTVVARRGHRFREDFVDHLYLVLRGVTYPCVIWAVVQFGKFTYGCNGVSHMSLGEGVFDEGVNGFTEGWLFIDFDGLAVIRESPLLVLEQHVLTLYQALPLLIR